MKYRCSHCDHVFQLEAKDFQRCPNCFWTTSLVLVEPNVEQPATQAATSSVPIAKVKKKRNSKIFHVLLIIFGVAVVGGIAVYVISRTNETRPITHLKPPPEDTIEALEKKKESAIRAATNAVKQLSDEERAALSAPFKLGLPRTLSEDEQAILKKQASYPTDLAKKPRISMWSADDFKALLDREQKKRKVPFKWSYRRSLMNTFEQHYLPGGASFEEGDYVKAQDLFIQSLALPIYQNNPKLHRAVVLVMLRPFINDVIGKIAVINQYFLGQRAVTDAESILTTYRSLDAMFESQNWREAIETIGNLRKQIDEFENRSDANMVRYPPSFAKVDAEIQSALVNESTPKPDALVNWKAVLIDLGLKEKVAQQNLSESIEAAQNRFDEALTLIEAGQLKGAEEKLRTIEHPPELASEAKKRLALLRKVVAIAGPQ